MKVDVRDGSGNNADVERLARLCRFVMRRMRMHPATELCVRLVDEDTIAALNQQWMGGGGPTDVLSFPMDELRPGTVDRDDAVASTSPDVAAAGTGLDEETNPDLGDIALCPQVAERQAPAAGHDPKDEVDLLLVHGVLHLLGFDHAEPDDHAHMFGLQARLLGEWQQVRAGADIE